MQKESKNLIQSLLFKELAEAEKTRDYLDKKLDQVNEWGVAKSAVDIIDRELVLAQDYVDLINITLFNL